MKLGGEGHTSPLYAVDYYEFGSQPVSLYFFFVFDKRVMATGPYPNLKDAILVSKAALYGRRSYLNVAKTDLTAAQVWDFDCAAALGADAAKYNLTKTEIEVYVLDTDVGSPTNGFYVPAGAVAGIGFKETGQVRVVNQHTATLSFIIRVFVVLNEV